MNALFSLMPAHRLELAQPSLLGKSYFYPPITLQRRWTRVGYTTFAEVMVPLLRVDGLRQVLPYFQGTQSGWGIDHLWAKFTSDPGHTCAIFDEVAVRHTRPVGSVFAKAMQSRGRSGLSEMDFGGVVRRPGGTSALFCGHHPMEHPVEGRAPLRPAPMSWSSPLVLWRQTRAFWSPGVPRLPLFSPSDQARCLKAPVDDADRC